MRFIRHQCVVHIKSGGVYEIVHTPEECRIEATGEPAYAYRGLPVDGAKRVLWVRPQAEMEEHTRFRLATIEERDEFAAARIAVALKAGENREHNI